MTARILIVRARPPEDALKGKEPLALGIATRRRDGWRFMPLTSARGPSRKGHKTWEAALPRWTGGLDGTESVGMEPGESIPSAVARIAARSASEEDRGSK
jgi:hypothetical protein